jgi:hypothetical protein
MQGMAEFSSASSIKVENQSLRDTVDTIRRSSLIDSEHIKSKGEEAQRAFMKELDECKRKLAEAVLLPEVCVIESYH